MPPMPPPNPPEIPDALVGQKITRAAQDLQANRLDQAESACRDALRLQPPPSPCNCWA